MTWSGSPVRAQFGRQWPTRLVLEYSDLQSVGVPLPRGLPVRIRGSTPGVCVADPGWHTFQIVGINGLPVNGPLKDTITIHPTEQCDVEFVPNNPGTWLSHCHNLVHVMGGLMTEVRYSS